MTSRLTNKVLELDTSGDAPDNPAADRVFLYAHAGIIHAIDENGADLVVGTLPTIEIGDIVGATDLASSDVGGSLEIDVETLQLVGDEDSPGNNKVFGTTGAGAKGWKDDPASGGDPNFVGQNASPTVTVNGTNAIGAGHLVIAAAEDSVALGQGAYVYASATNSLAIGTGSLVGASAIDSIACGPGSSVEASDSIAMGSNAAVDSYSYSSIAIGAADIANCVSSIAIGSGDSLVASGVTMGATKSVGMGFDIDIAAGGQHHVVIGYEINMEGVSGSNIIIGDRSHIYAAGDTPSDDCIVLGSGAEITDVRTYLTGYTNSNGTIAIGTGAKVNGANRCIAIGENTAAYGYNFDVYLSNAIAIGDGAKVSGKGGISIGLDCYVGGWLASYGVVAPEYAIAMGHYAASLNPGQISFATGGDAQIHSQKEIYVLRGETTDDTSLLLSPDDSGSNRIYLRPGDVLNFTTCIMGRNADMDVLSGKYSGTIKRDFADNTSLVGAIDIIHEVNDTGASTWSIAITADDTNEALQIQVTGPSADTVRWGGTVDIAHIGDLFGSLAPIA